MMLNICSCVYMSSIYLLQWSVYPNPFSTFYVRLIFFYPYHWVVSISLWVCVCGVYVCMCMWWILPCINYNMQIYALCVFSPTSDFPSDFFNMSFEQQNFLKCWNRNFFFFFFFGLVQSVKTPSVLKKKKGGKRGYSWHFSWY